MTYFIIVLPARPELPFVPALKRALDRALDRAMPDATEEDRTVARRLQMLLAWRGLAQEAS